MIDIGMGEWIKEYDGYMLMKFTSTYDFQQDFLDGKLFFNTSDFFQRCDNKGRGDATEGNTFIINQDDPGLISANIETINGRVMIVERDFSKTPEKYKPSTVISYSEAENRRRKLISFYTMYVNVHEHRIKKFPSNMAEEFGMYGILITNRQEFYERVNHALSKMKNCNKAQMGFVEYQDRTPGHNEWYPFRKDKNDFEYQNEFRITFINDNEDVYKLDLECSLRDIAVPIMAKQINNICFVGDNLQYPVQRDCLLRKLRRIVRKKLKLI